MVVWWLSVELSLERFAKPQAAGEYGSRVVELVVGASSKKRNDGATGESDRAASAQGLTMPSLVRAGSSALPVVRSSFPTVRVGLRPNVPGSHVADLPSPQLPHSAGETSSRSKHAKRSLLCIAGEVSR